MSTKHSICYVVVEYNDPGERIGLVMFPETGYYLTTLDNPTMTDEDVQLVVDKMNETLGLSKEAVQLMKSGSMFNWPQPLVDKLNQL